MQNNKECFLIIDKHNFDEHFLELSELFGLQIEKDPSFELRSISGGHIEYRRRPRGPKYDDKSFKRYGVNAYFDEHRIYTRPRFYIRLHNQEGESHQRGLILLVECIGKELLDKWEEKFKEDKDFFRKDRAILRLSNNTYHDKIYWDGEETTYLRFSIKPDRLTVEQQEKILAMFKHFFSISRSAWSEHGLNKYVIEELKVAMESMVTQKEKVI